MNIFEINQMRSRIRRMPRCRGMPRGEEHSTSYSVRIVSNHDRRGSDFLIGTHYTAGAAQRQAANALHRRPTAGSAGTPHGQQSGVLRPVQPPHSRMPDGPRHYCAVLNLAGLSKLVPTRTRRLSLGTAHSPPRPAARGPGTATAITADSLRSSTGRPDRFAAEILAPGIHSAIAPDGRAQPLPKMPWSEDKQPSSLQVCP